MLPGIAGRLIAEAGLEQRLGTRPVEAAVLEAHRSFRHWRLRGAQLGPASSLRAMSEVGAGPLALVLGYVPSPYSTQAGSVAVLDLVTSTSRIPCLVCTWAARMDPLWLSGALAGLSHGSRWGLIFNGTHLRVLDGVCSHSKRWLEFDLDLAAGEIRTFAALWLTVRAEMLTAAPSSGATPLAQMVQEADAFASDVCRSLRIGVLSASSDVLNAMLARRRAQEPQAAFEQALTVVYRMLFLLFAESRGLVPMWHPIYKEGYSVDALRSAVERGRLTGLWDALRAMSRLAHAGCRTGSLRVTAFNGRLFDGTRSPLLDRRDLDDEAAGRAVLALTTRVSRERGGRERIAYRDLGVEQLGAVYETLLDYEPRRQAPVPDASSATRGLREAVALERGSGARKATGSFYTPQPIAHYLVRQTIGPLVRGRSADEILRLTVLDPSMGSGAFLVAACGFLAEAYEEALLASGGCLPDDIGPQERAAIRRQVAERCLFGVDLNPMAVQLARLSLWLATLSRDRPLSFLDHRIRVGDSLVGAWLSCLTRPPVRLRRQDVDTASSLFGNDFQSAAQSALPVRFALAGPNETIEQVRAKERALAGLERPESALSRWKRTADLWCAQWFMGAEAPPASAFGALADAARHGRSDLPAHLAQRYLTRAAEVAGARRFFHWELEFPEIFFGAGGERLPAAGFDAVVGNPPWDMIRADSGSAENRTRSRAEAGRLLRFTRDSGLYDAQSEGHPNRYQLFLERSVALARPGGRVGLVLPGGFASDHGSANVRRLLLSRCALDGVVGFDNRRAVFPIHRSVRFLLLTATKGHRTERFGMRMGEVDPGVLEECARPGWFPVQLSVDLLEMLSGRSLALPDLRQPVDLAIAERAAALFAPLGASGGWGARFGRELNATDDRSLFIPPGRGLPVVEGRLIDPFRVRLEDAARAVRGRDASRLLGPRCRRPRLAYRDVASATNRLTMIAALLPAGCASTHTVLCLRTPLPVRAQHFLCGLLNSFVVNYLVRQRVATHVTAAIVEQLPVPRRQDAPAAFMEVAALAHRLGRERSLNERAGALARLNARVAALYQLSREEFAHVLSTFPLIPEDERSRALELHRG